MPVSFLSTAQRESYGRYVGDPSTDELARYFHLDDADRVAIAEKRGDHNRLGFALQLTTVRFLGTFLEQPTEVPAIVLHSLQRQLSMTAAARLADYAQAEQRWTQAAQLWLRLANNITETQQTQLAALLRVADGARNSPLDELRSGAFHDQRPGTRAGDSSPADGAPYRYRHPTSGVDPAESHRFARALCGQSESLRSYAAAGETTLGNAGRLHPYPGSLGPRRCPRIVRDAPD